MEIVIAVIAVAVLGLGALVAVGKFGAMPAEPVRDTYQPPVDGRLTAADLEGIRFGIAPFGYDQRQVDEVLARVARELDQRGRPEVHGEPAPGPWAEPGMEQRAEPGIEQRAEPGIEQRAEPEQPAPEQRGQLVPEQRQQPAPDRGVQPEPGPWAQPEAGVWGRPHNRHPDAE